MTASAPQAPRTDDPQAAHGLKALSSAEELGLAGRVSGVLYLTGAITAPALLLPGPVQPDAWVLWGEVALAGGWGLACLLLVPWDRAPIWLSYASTLAGLPFTAALVAASGGTQSQAQIYLLFVVIFAAYFYPRWEALGFILASAAVRALPLLYQSRAVDQGVLRSIVIGFGTYLVTGGAIICGRSLVDQLRTRAREMSEQRERTLAQHASLRHVATAVATSSPPRAVFTLVASEAQRLLEADGAAVLRYDGDEVELVGTCGPERPNHSPGTRFPIPATPELAQVRLTGQPVRTDGYASGSRHPGAVLGYQCCVCAPVWVEQRVWGALSVVAHEAFALPAGTEERLQEFAHLVTTSIANTERQAELVRLASIDPLTGLANHRSFHERLESEVSRSLRHQRSLALALVDVDHFRKVNDQVGHAGGDQVLVEIAEILRGLTRKCDLLARLGVDQFGLLLPETDKRAAFAVLERARQAVARQPVGGFGRVSLTTGVCDLESAGGEGSLYRMAEAALQWGKAHGRDVTWIYDPEIVRPVAPCEPEDEVERSRALAGLQALSRAIDAKDPLTREHSERVAGLAAQLARAAGWDPDRVLALENAALVHDVGKIGVPDAVLLKPDRLDTPEYEAIRQHAALGAQIVEGVLSSEQVEWIRSHHERPDGHGYPNGLIGTSISEGAALLALADAFDAMTTSRVYSSAKAITAAVAECRALEGRQFTYTAVRALENVYAKGALVAA